MGAIELLHTADVSSVNDKENQSFDDSKSSDVNHGAEVAFDAFFEEAITVVMLESSRDREDRRVPERNNCQRNRLVGLRSSVEVVITVKTQLLMMIPYNIIEELCDNEKKIVYVSR